MEGRLKPMARKDPYQRPRRGVKHGDGIATVVCHEQVAPAQDHEVRLVELVPGAETNLTSAPDEGLSSVSELPL